MRCEWNPLYDIPAHHPRRQGDCDRDAVLLVGKSDQWRLCVQCAQLPQFKGKQQDAIRLEQQEASA